jgi:hypothetical protein
VPNCCKYKADGTREEINKKIQNLSQKKIQKLFCTPWKVPPDFKHRLLPPEAGLSVAKHPGHQPPGLMSKYKEIIISQSFSWLGHAAHLHWRLKRKQQKLSRMGFLVLNCVRWFVEFFSFGGSKSGYRGGAQPSDWTA